MNFNTAVAHLITCLHNGCSECRYARFGVQCKDQMRKECMPVIHEAKVPFVPVGSRDTSDNALEAKVTNLLITIGVPASLQGFRYLRDAIVIGVENPDALDNITKVLYPRIAQKFSTAPIRVERSIRHAIEVCFDRADMQDLSDTFGSTVNMRKGKSTNSEFISIIVERIRHNL